MTKKLTLGEIVFIAVLSSALGVLWWGYSYAYELIHGIFKPFGLTTLLEGVWLTGGLFFPYIIRKPGSAFLGELIAASVQAAISGYWGAQSLAYGAFQGLGAEMIFLAFGYKNFRIPVMMLAGAAAAIPSFFLSFYWYAYFKISGVYGSVVLYNGILLTAFVISGAVFSLLSKYLADVLKKTGALNTFRIARD